MEYQEDGGAEKDNSHTQGNEGTDIRESKSDNETFSEDVGNKILNTCHVRKK